jgi:origin recognition complex subunit 6
MIRHVCKTCGLPGAAPHVFVATSTVANEIGSRSLGGGSAAKKRRRTPQRGKDSPAIVEAPALPATGVPLPKWPALLTTMYLIAASKMLGVELDDAKVQQWRAKAVETVTAYLESNAAKLPAGLDAEVAQLDTAVGFYLLEAEDCGWLNMEWYQNVPVTADLHDEDEADDGDGEDADDLDDAEEGSFGRRKQPAKTPLRRSEKHGAATRRFLDDGREDPGAAGLLPGLATMFQPAVDWLSDERRADYTTWKHALSRELAVLQQGA